MIFLSTKVLCLVTGNVYACFDATDSMIVLVMSFKKGL